MFEGRVLSKMMISLVMLTCAFPDPRNSTNIIDLNHQCGGYIDPATLSPVGYKQWDGINMRYAKGYICPLGQTCKVSTQLQGTMTRDLTQSFGLECYR
jgi:hypothetical protein